MSISIIDRSSYFHEKHKLFLNEVDLANLALLSTIYGVHIYFVSL